MSKPTPGPWAIRNAREVFKGGRRICHVNSGESLSIGDDMERAASNARLIASAPCLLSALQAMLTDAENVRRVMLAEVGCGMVDEVAVSNAERAIAKATGAAQ